MTMLMMMSMRFLIGIFRITLKSYYVISIFIFYVFSMYSQYSIVYIISSAFSTKFVYTNAALFQVNIVNTYHDNDKKYKTDCILICCEDDHK